MMRKRRTEQRVVTAVSGWALACIIVFGLLGVSGIMYGPTAMGFALFAGIVPLVLTVFGFEVADVFSKRRDD